MTLDELFNLKHEVESIKLIDLFIKENKDQTTKIKATVHKYLLLNSLNKTQEALKNLLQLTSKLDELDKESSIAICDGLISIFMNIESYDNALKYIDIKNKYLLESQKQEYTYDLIKFYYLIKNYEDTKRNINIFINENIDDVRQTEIYEIYAEILLIDNNTTKFYDIYEKLKQDYLKKYETTKLEYISIQYANCLIKDNKLDEALEFLLDLKIEQEYQDYDFYKAKLLIDIYILTDQIRKATNLESKFYDYLNNASTYYSMIFSESALKLYNILGNKKSISYYENIIEDCNKKLDQINNEKNSNKKKINIDKIRKKIIIDSPNTKETIKEEIKIDKYIEEIIDKPTKIEISKNYKSIEHILDSLCYSDIKRFRDYLKYFGSLLEKIYPKTEIVLLDTNTNNGFHYKVDRVYSKKFDNSNLQNSSFYDLVNEKKEYIFIDDLTKYNYKNIITNEAYEESVKFIIGFKLFSNSQLSGAILYSFEIDKFDDLFIFENLKLYSKIANIFYNEHLLELVKEDENYINNHIINNINHGIKIQKQNTLFLNKQATNILGLDEKCYISDMFNVIDINDLSSYKTLLNDMYEKNIYESIIYYKINNKFVKETIFLDKNNTENFYSFIEDMTDIKTETDELTKLVYNNPTSKMQTKTKFILDVKEIFEEKKFSICILDIKNFKRFSDIYGIKFSNDLIKAMGITLLKVIEKYKNVDVYHFDSDKYIILFKTLNDIRAVSKTSYAIIDKLKEELYKLNTRLDLYFNAGIIRYMKSMNVKNIDKLLEYGFISLDESKKTPYNNVTIFTDEVFKKYNLEQQIAIHISEAIDTNTLQLKYSQIVDISSSSINRYLATLNLENFIIDQDKFNEIVDKKDLRDLIDKYLIKSVINDLKLLYNKTLSYTKVLIPISISTLNSRLFIDFLKEQFHFYKIPLNIISFYIIENVSSKVSNIDLLNEYEIQVYSKNIDIVLLNNIEGMIVDKNIYSIDIIEQLHNMFEISNKNIIVSNVNEKEEVTSLDEINVRFAYGKQYNKMYNISEIIDIINIIKNTNKKAENK
ncbi:MAG: EAL domain-containing protein [Anaeroplasmataceae bacterium]